MTERQHSDLAFADVAERVAPRLFRIGVRMCGSAAEAEDLSSRHVASGIPEVAPDSRAAPIRPPGLTPSPADYVSAGIGGAPVNRRANGVPLGVVALTWGIP